MATPEAGTAGGPNQPGLMGTGALVPAKPLSRGRFLMKMSGCPAPQVADWAGYGVDVLLRVYAKCISGQQDETKRRVGEATRPHEER